MAAEREQVLFLLDTGSSDEWRKNLFSVVCRILMNHVHIVPDQSRNPLQSVKWSYQFIDTGSVSRGLPRGSFIDLNTENLSRFKEKLVGHAHNDHTPQSLYLLLGEVVQGYTWDAPVLSTPTVSKRRRSRTLKSHDCHVTNRIYVVSDIFSRGEVGGASYEDSVLNVIFPSALTSQLINKNILINIIWIPSNEQSSNNLVLLRSHLQTFHGNVVPLTVLLAPPTATPTSLLPPETFINRKTVHPKPRPQNKPHPLHILCTSSGSHFCHISVSPVSTTNPISSLYTDSILRLMPISVIMNRDILFHHLLFKETVICTGVVSSGKVLYEGFKNLCASLSSNSQSLVLRVMNDSKDVLLILQPQTCFISTLTAVSSIYNSLYVKDPETPPTAPPLSSTETLSTTPPLSPTEAPPTAPPPPVVDDEIRSTTDSEILISLNRVGLSLLSRWSPLTLHYGCPSDNMARISHDECTRDGSTLQRVLEQLQQRYSPFVFINDDDEHIKQHKEVEVFQSVLSKFSDDLSKINSSEHSVILQSVKDLVVLFLSSCEPSVDSVGGEEVPRERIWAELKETILKTDAQLREETNNETKRIIQIILHFHLYDYFNEDTSFTNTLVQLLRGYSLLFSPILMGKLLKDTILPEYSTCKNLLKDVFEELMMPLPACLSPYSGSSTPVQSRNESESEEGEGEGEGPSCPRSLELSFTEEPIQRTNLAHRASLQGPTLSRQISISMKKPKVGNNSSKSKKVCRSLFSLNEESDRRKGRKRRRDKTNNDVVVMETPVKKQVENYRQYKLQRSRSKMGVDCSEGVVSIDESPQRSFYSAKLKPNNQIIQFNTPPYKPTGLNKDPSPAVLHSLLHGEWATPSTADTTPTADTQTTPNRSRAPPQSPDIFNDNVLRSYVSARTLTYSPLGTCRASSETPRKAGSFGSDSSYPTTPLRSILKTPDRATPKRKSVSFGRPEGEEEVSLATICVPLEPESASMMAFNFSTPTKESSNDFTGLFKQ